MRFIWRYVRAMLLVLANRTYRSLFAAQVIALVRTGLMTVALALLAFELAGEKAGRCSRRSARCSSGCRCIVPDAFGTRGGAKKRT